MASKSKAAQEQLAELEKGSAPFEKQLVEAAKFVGVDLDTLRNPTKDGEGIRSSATVARYFGREEWLLKWLLKKLQTPADPEPRTTTSSWTLLLHVLRAIPVANAAKSLAEKQFIAILQLALQDVKLLATDSVKTKKHEESAELPIKTKSAKSLKRKRSGALVEDGPSPQKNENLRLLETIRAVVDYIVAASDAASAVDLDEGLGRAFSAEYMQMVIRTTPEEAAKTLGSWMEVFATVGSQSQESSATKDWLLPFIEIWSSHTTHDEAHSQFSLYCTQPLLALLRGFKFGQHVDLDWSSQLEQLLARNVVNPAKALRSADPESDILNTLTRASVIQDVSNAPILFEVAIRSIKPHASKRRRGSDDTWLQLVFASLKESMPQSTKQHEKNGLAISAMLQLAKDHKVNLDLSVLRAITSEYALPEGRDGWELVAAMIELDANVFLIDDKEGEKDLLQELLTRITHASAKPTWSEISKQVVSNVVLPLMNEFAKARDLIGFVHHWYAQLVKFESLRNASELSLDFFSAWEDASLQTELAKLLEPSLTIQQIEQILDWLSVKVNSSSDTVCLLLDAITNSIAGEAVIDAVGLRLYHIMFDGDAFEKLDARYKWRSWRIISRMVGWTTYQNIDKLLGLWQQKSRPFNFFSDSFDSVAFFKVPYRSTRLPLERLEIFRLVVSLWSAPESGNLKADLIRPVMLDLLRSFARGVDSYFENIQIPDGNHDSTESLSEPMMLSRSYSWVIWSYVKFCFVEHPKILVLGLELEDGVFRGLLQNVLRLASASTGLQDLEWLRLNPNAYPSLWLSALAHDDILNAKKLAALMIDVMLSNQTNYDNSLISKSTTNEFAVKCLLGLRIETLNKKQRETILKGWLPTSDSDDERRGLSYTNALDPAVLSLKIKMMRNPVFYEGMEFDQFVRLATALNELETSRKDINLALLKEFCQRTFEYIHIIPNEARNKAYITDAFKTIKKRVKKAADKSKHKLSYAFITIVEVVLKVLLDAKTQVIEKEDVESIVTAFKDHLVDQLKEILRKLRKGRADNSQDESLTILSAIDALLSLGAGVSEVSELREDATAFAASDKSQLNVGVRLETFIFTTIYGSSTGLVSEVDVDTELVGDIRTTCGRQAIVQKAKALALGGNEQKLKLLDSIFGPGLIRLTCADKLLAARQVIISLEDTGKSEDEEAFDLSEAYSILCGQLWKTTSFVQFCIISETLELMLQTKPRSITQFSVDTTLGSIAIICSRNGPSLNPARANTIYIHLCNLFRAILQNHRLKLQGHMHLVLQTMQALLRCLFRPLAHTSKTSKFGSPPPWLSSTSTSNFHHLTPAAGEAFTRLVTLICDPTESSVRGKYHNKLTSATEKWKNIAGWHMQFLLMEYVNLQLEMRMESSVREKLVQGLYAIFDTTTMEGRRLIGARLDASQRAVFGVLVKDYLRFGKWKGS